MYHVLGYALLLLLLYATPALAHDCWLQPDHFRIGLETLLVARLFVGHLLKPEKELPLEKQMTPRLDLLRPEGAIDLRPLLNEGDTPLVTCRAEAQGPGLLVMERDFTDITLANDKFGHYIAHEKHAHLLPQVLANPRGEQKERYARCAKAWVYFGEGADDMLYSQVAGLRLEILLTRSPLRMESGEPLRAKVLFNGRPLPDKHVTAYHQPAGQEARKLSAKTDADGLATFEAAAPGLWLLHLIHLYPYRGEQDLDWESYWSTFCFEIPPV
jgi:uncharacterized GH25 family protein